VLAVLLLGVVWFVFSVPDRDSAWWAVIDVGKEATNWAALLAGIQPLIDMRGSVDLLGLPQKLISLWPWL
jgi:hypothetical protein